MTQRVRTRIEGLQQLTNAQDLRYSVAYPIVVEPGKWYPLRVVVRRKEVAESLPARALEPDLADGSRGYVSYRQQLPQERRDEIPYGLLLSIEPVPPREAELVFNPTRTQLGVYDFWQHADFRFLAPKESLARSLQSTITFTLPDAANAPLTEASMDVSVREHVVQFEEKQAGAPTYQRVFLSYASVDGNVVMALAESYRSLGMDVALPETSLAASAHGNQEIQKLVAEADTLVLFWPEAAARSRTVEAEWRHALTLGKAIRPIYWQRPMPRPPAELAGYHFAFAELGGVGQ